MLCQASERTGVALARDIGETLVKQFPENRVWVNLQSNDDQQWGFSIHNIKTFDQVQLRTVCFDKAVATIDSKQRSISYFVSFGVRPKGIAHVTAHGAGSLYDNIAPEIPQLYTRICDVVERMCATMTFDTAEQIPTLLSQACLRLLSFHNPLLELSSVRSTTRWGRHGSLPGGQVDGYATLDGSFGTADPEIQQSSFDDVVEYEHGEAETKPTNAPESSVEINDAPQAPATKELQQDNTQIASERPELDLQKRGQRESKRHVTTLIFGAK